MTCARVLKIQRHGADFEMADQAREVCAPRFGISLYNSPSVRRLRRPEVTTRGSFQARLHARPSSTHRSFRPGPSKNNVYPKDRLKVSGKSAQAAGGLINNPYLDLVTYKKYRPELQFTSVPGFGKVEHQFLVEGKGTITVSYDSRHAGKMERKAELK
jgi:hypothetical protein